MIKTKKGSFWDFILDITEEEFIRMNLTPLEASLLIDRSICRCNYYGQEIKLSKESIEVLYILAEAKGRIISTKDLTEKLNYMDPNTLNKRIKRLNEQFKKINSTNCKKIVLNERKIGYKLNTDIIDTYRLWLV